MDTNLVIGVFLIVFGLYSIFARFFAPHHLGKLGPMKKMWGEKAGVLIHVLAYTALPLLRAV